MCTLVFSVPVGCCALQTMRSIKMHTDSDPLKEWQLPKSSKFIVRVGTDLVVLICTLLQNHCSM